MLLLGLVAFLLVSSGSPSVKLTSASADARFNADANAAASQYGCSSCTTTGPTGIGVTATVTVGAGTPRSARGSTPGLPTSTGGATASNTSGHGSAGHGGTAGGGPAGSNGAGSAVTGAPANTSASGPAYCGQLPAVQTPTGFDFNTANSNDIGLFGYRAKATAGAAGVALAPTAQALQTDPFSGGERLGRNLVAAGDTGYAWTNTAGSTSTISYCQFAPVTPKGVWGVELYCNQDTACNDTGTASSEDPTDANKPVAVTGTQHFTVPAHRVALALFRLNRTGKRLLKLGLGHLTGVTTLAAVGSQPPVTGQRNFSIYLVR